MVTIVVILLLIAAIVLVVVVVKKNLTMSDQREQLVDQIEESLDVLDACFQRLSHNAEANVLSDEPVIREVMSDIRRSRNAVLAIASKVVAYGSEPDEKDDE